MNILKNKIKKLPKSPGVYLMKNAEGKIIYIGKATSLRSRVANYFVRPHDSRIEKLVAEITNIDYKKTPTVIEALILEANLIKKHLPKYNIKEKDDKSFLYVIFTEEEFPRLILLRGHETKKIQNSKGKNKNYTSKLKIKKLFGPFTSASSLRAALDILQKIFPYRNCATFPKRPCLQYHLKRCGAPCVNLISGQEYRKNIKNLILFFEGKKEKIIKNLKREMTKASQKENFEKAAQLRNQIFALEHIQDVAIITNDKLQMTNYKNIINIFGRIEGYDISNISGTSATGSMVVFENGKPNKNEYRKFKIKTLSTPNDVAMMKEIIKRRLAHEEWARPNLILVDGGWGQINAVREILADYKLKIPVLGIAKGFNRKQDRVIYDKENLELKRVVEQYKNLLLQVRDEAHRFAQNYHKMLRRKKLLKE